MEDSTIVLHNKIDLVSKDIALERWEKLKETYDVKYILPICAQFGFGLNYLSQFICCTLRPNQLTIQSKNEKKIDIYYLIDNLCINKMSGIKIVESSHSIDILSKHITKLNIVQYIKDLLKEKNISTNILCVGDKGQWPGNDFELLSTEYALSVDEVSHNPKTCWNLASVGKRNISATEEYLELIHVNNKKKSFTFKY